MSFADAITCVFFGFISLVLIPPDPYLCSNFDASFSSETLLLYLEINPLTVAKLSSSYREGFGTVLIEAAAMGIPALASRIYGITDAVVEGETGLLHTAKAVNEIAEKMQLLATDAGLRKRLGEQAKQRARRDFSQAYVTGEVVAFYARVVPAVIR